jgi:hypothetical protein
MNARQKAKKYKRELDILKGQVAPFKFKSALGKVETIGVEECFRMEDISKVPPKIIVNSMIRALMDTDQIRQAMTLDNHYVMETDTMIIRADLKVVMPDESHSRW